MRSAPALRAPRLASFAPVPAQCAGLGAKLRSLLPPRSASPRRLSAGQSALRSAPAVCSRSLRGSQTKSAFGIIAPAGRGNYRLRARPCGSYKTRPGGCSIQNVDFVWFPLLGTLNRQRTLGAVDAHGSPPSRSARTARRLPRLSLTVRECSSRYARRPSAHRVTPHV